MRQTIEVTGLDVEQGMF